MFANVLGTGFPVVLLQASGGFGSPLGSLFSWILGLFIFYLIIRFIGKLNKPIVTEHKYQLFELTQLSALDFYKTVEGVLDGMQIPELKHSRITYGEGGMLSARREYLRVLYQGLGYTICGAPYGTSFFISWREDEPGRTGQSIASNIPYVGRLLARFFEKTRYREDTELMYRETVQGVMKRMIDAIGKEGGVRGLTELGQKPVYQRTNPVHGDN